MKLNILSDLHLSLGALAIPRNDADVVILAGDVARPTEAVSWASGFAKPVQRAAAQLGVDPRDVFFELGRRKVVGGQEDLILEVATELARRSKPGPNP